MLIFSFASNILCAENLIHIRIIERCLSPSKVREFLCKVKGDGRGFGAYKNSNLINFEGGCFPCRVAVM